MNFIEFGFDTHFVRLAYCWADLIDIEAWEALDACVVEYLATTGTN